VSTIEGQTNAMPAAAPGSDAGDDAVLALPIDPWSPRESEAVAFTNGLTLRARAVFADINLDAAARRQAFRTLVSDLFDVDALGRALLGGNRDRLNDRQYASYQRVITDYLVPLYANRIYRVCSSSADLVSVEEKERGVTVRTAYRSEPTDTPVVVDWLLDPHPDGSWRVLDMAVNGISLAQSKMEEFNSVLKQEGTDAFLERLHAQAGESLPQPLASPVEPPNSKPRPGLH
jgi:phospholipid transport system substrate-binding protein